MSIRYLAEIMCDYCGKRVGHNDQGWRQGPMAPALRKIAHSRGWRWLVMPDKNHGRKIDVCPKCYEWERNQK